MRFLSTWLRRVTIVAALVGLAIALALMWLFSTPTGSAFIANAAAKLTGGAVTVRAFSGRLSNRFSADTIEVKLEGTYLLLEQATIRWSPTALLNKTLEIGRIDINRLTLEHLVTEQEDTQPALPQLPLRARLGALNINTLDVSFNGTSERLTDVHFGGEFSSNLVTIKNLELQRQQHEVNLRGEVSDPGPLTVDLHAEWRGAFDGEPMSATARAAGPLDDLELSATTEGLLQTKTRATVNALERPLAFEVELVHTGSARLPESVIVEQGTFNARGNLDRIKWNYRVSGAVEPLGELIWAADGTLDQQAGRLAIPFGWQLISEQLPGGMIKADGTVSYADDKLIMLQSTASPNSTTLNARADLAVTGPPQFEVDFGWQDLVLPGGDDDKLSAERGALRATGVPTDARLTLDAEWLHPAIGRATSRLSARLSDNRLEISDGIADLLDGQLVFSGTAGFGEALLGKFDVQGSGLALGRLFEELDSDIAFSASAEFTKRADGFSAALKIPSLVGRWQDNFVNADADLTIDNDAISVERLDVSLGDNALSATARLAETVDGQFDVDISDLRDFLPSIAGSVNANGRFSGKRERPVVVGELRARKLKIGEWSVAGITSAFDLDLDGKQRSSLQVAIEEALSGDAVNADVTLTLEGFPNAHQTSVGVKSNLGNAQLEASGDWRDERWRGQIEDLTVDSAAVAEWRLQKPVALRVDKTGAISLEEGLCLVQAAASVCAKLARDKQGMVDAEGGLIAIPLALANAWMPTTVRTDGLLDASFAFKTGGKSTLGRLQYEVRDGSIVVTAVGESPERIPVTRLTGLIEGTPDLVDIQSDTQIGNWLDAQLSGQLDVASDALELKLDVTSPDIRWLSEFVPEMAGSHGKAQLAGTVSGTRSAPTVAINGGLVGGEIIVQETGMLLSALDLNVRSRSETRLAIDVAATAVSGSLNATGTLDLEPEKSWPFDFRVSGENFAAARTPELELDVSPDIRISGDIERVQITGAAKIPRLNYTIAGLPKSAVTVSDDQVIVDGGVEQEGKEPARSWFDDSLALNVTVVIGDNVTVEGLGAFAQLGGAIEINKAFGGDLTGNGTVNISKGSFDAYSQTLSITDGRLLFAGPVTNPSLNIRAVRDDIEIIAGVVVTGTVRAPKFEVFSEPSLPAADTLSYIVTGRPLSDGTQADGALIAQAAIGFGLEQSTVITNQIRDLFALDELRVATGDQLDQAALVAGKQLTPKLSVRSEMNLFDQLWSFFFRYKLTKNWSVEAESGDAQGADIIYNIEREKILD